MSKHTNEILSAKSAHKPLKCPYATFPIKKEKKSYYLFSNAPTKHPHFVLNFDQPTNLRKEDTTTAVNHKVKEPFLNCSEKMNNCDQIRFNIPSYLAAIIKNKFVQYISYLRFYQNASNASN